MLKRVKVEYYKWVNEETGEEFTNHEDAIKGIIPNIGDADIEFFDQDGEKYTLDALLDDRDYEYIHEDDFYAVKVKTQKGVEFVKKVVQGDIRDRVARNGIGEYIWDKDEETFVNYESIMRYYKGLYDQYFCKAGF